MISFWERRSFSHYDHVIIGAGIVGLSVALELRQRQAGQRILVLERGFFPTGASTKNAGFACMGSLTELIADARSMPEEDILALFEKRRSGLSMLRQRLGDNRIGYQASGSYELIGDQSLCALDRLEEWNEKLYPLLGQRAFEPCNEKIKSFGFSSSYAKALVENTCEGSIDTGKMMRALVDTCLEQAIEIKTGADVLSFEENGKGVSLQIKDPLGASERIAIQAGHVFVCTNAFSKRFFPEANVQPGRGQVCITAPIDRLPFRGIFHFEEGYFYFRTIDQRVLFGGGRNRDIHGEHTEEIALNEKIQSLLDQYLREIILPGIPHEVEQRWAGIMAFGDTKVPLIRACSERVYAAFRMGGMGVALGSGVARDLVNMMYL